MSLLAHRRTFGLVAATATVAVYLGVGAGTVRAAPPRPTSDGAAETPGETELMLKALTAERGESPNARRIDRATAQARAEAQRKRASMATIATVWKDPFAEDPDREVPVRMSAPHRQRGNEVTAVRRELARARAETAAAQATAAAAQAEAAQAKANSARAEALAARVQAMAARHEATAARAECTEPEKAKHAGRAHRPDNPDGLGRFAVADGARSDTASQKLASKTRAPRPAAAAVSKPAPSATGMVLSNYDEPEPPVPVPEVHAAATPSGIIVVPITR